MRRRINLSLQQRIVLLVLIGVALGLVLISWLGVQSMNQSTERVLDERLTIARVLADHLDHTIESIWLQMGNADLGDVLHDETQVVTRLAATRDMLNRSGIAVQSILLIGPTGSVIAVEGEGVLKTGSDASAYPGVIAAMSTGRPVISDSVVLPSATSPVVLASVPVLDGDGQPIAVLTCLISLEQSTDDTFNPALDIGDTGYVELVDGMGYVLTRTDPGRPLEPAEMSDHPEKFAELIQEQQASVRTCHRCHEAGGPKSRDVLAFAPLSEASWGVAIRQTEEEALAPTRQLLQRIVVFSIIVMVGTFLLVWLLMRGIVRPVKALTEATRRVASGDFRPVTQPQRHDEIGQLGVAFFTMTQELAESRQELVSRNDELSALNSLSATVNRSLNLDDVVTNAIARVLELTRAEAGCVMLGNPDGVTLRLNACVGQANLFQCAQVADTAADCACHQVLRHGQTLLVNHPSQCPVLTSGTAPTDEVGGFVCIPLKSKDKTLGVMNIAGSTGDYFTETGFRILNSVGYQVGLAIENCILYEEAKEGEEVRGRLLSRIINTQEEERRRISREVHDEFGQALTGLMLNLEMMETNLPAEDTSLRAKLKSAKDTVASTLENMRRLTFGLRPSTLDDLGLVPAVRSYIQSYMVDRGIEIFFEGRGLSGRLDPEVETAVFRIVQEAIHNIVKHAGAKHVKLSLDANASRIEVRVEDDGSGFDVAAVRHPKSETKSMGLLGIRERVSLLGGNFNIQSRIGEGTTLLVEIPLNELH